MHKLYAIVATTPFVCKSKKKYGPTTTWAQFSTIITVPYATVAQIATTPHRNCNSLLQNSKKFATASTGQIMWWNIDDGCKNNKSTSPATNNPTVTATSVNVSMVQTTRYKLQHNFGFFHTAKQQNTHTPRANALLSNV